MKRFFKSSLLLATVAVGLSACLKDTGYTDLFEGKTGSDQPIVSIFGDQSGEHVLGVNFSTALADVEVFSLNVGSAQKLSQDVTATVAVNPALLTGTTYLLLPTNAYTIPNQTVTIKAGQRDAPFMVKINSSLIDLTKEYALPLSITGATGALVASNLKDAVYVIKVNNVYSGAYQATGTFTHPTAGERKINEEKILGTIDATTSQAKFADLGGSGWLMWLKVNPDNTVTLIPKGAASAGTVQFGVNKYDPATKTFTLNYKYVGGGGDRVISETIKKK